MTNKLIKAERASDNVTVYVYKERARFFSTFAKYESETDGYVCFAQEFNNAKDAIEYANRIVAKLAR